MEKGLIEKTGKDLKYWIGILKATGLQKHGEMLKYLKTEHGFTHGFANFVALKTREADAGSSAPEDLVSRQYEGKESLRPIYDRLVELVTKLGNDVEIAPKKSAVSIRGPKRQFLLIQPSTKTRVDLGLKYTDAPMSDRLKGSGSFGSMCTNSVSITQLSEVDDALIDLITQAYHQAR